MTEALTGIEHIREFHDPFHLELPHGSLRIRGGAKQFSNDQLLSITQLD